MFIMEGKSLGKDKTEDIAVELHGTNHTLRRPKNFNFQRRRNVYYFSDNSARGILKRVPIKNGSYRLNDLQTVLEKSDATSSETDNNNSSAKSDGPYESAHHEEMRKSVLQSLDETAKFKPGLKNLTILQTYEDYRKNKKYGSKSLKGINADQAKGIFKGLEKKKKQAQVFEQTDSGDLKGHVSYDKSEKLSSSNMRSRSSKKPDERQDNLECLSERWAERSLTVALSQMPLKPPTTEL